MTEKHFEEDELRCLVEDLLYHQTRVLLLVAAVSNEPAHNRKLDGLTKLAKLDFLVRYPALSPIVLDRLDHDDDRLHLTDAERLEPTDVEDPMVRYKYGPWDDRYYRIIGALVSRGLLRYSKGRKGSVALVPTPLGKTLASDLRLSAGWDVIADRCHAIAENSSGLSGNALKELIYERLAILMDRPHRQVIE